MAFARSLALGLFWCTAPAWAADLPDPIRVLDTIAVENPCGDPNVLERIVERFAWAERNTWHRGFEMDVLENGRQGGHGFYEPGLIRREYCTADSRMTDGSAHTVYFVIEFGQGLASLGTYVDFCVGGLDPWHVHDEACRTVR